MLPEARVDQLHIERHETRTARASDPLIELDIILGTTHNNPSRRKLVPYRRRGDCMFALLLCWGLWVVSIGL